MRTCLQKFYPKGREQGGLVATGALGVDGQAPKTESNQPTHTDTEREKEEGEGQADRAKPSATPL